MSPPQPRENLLQAALAVQLGMIRLEDAFEHLERCRSNGMPLADRLLDDGLLNEEQREMLLAIAEVHQAGHGRDVEASLASLERTDSGGLLQGADNDNDAGTVAYVDPQRAPPQAENRTDAKPEATILFDRNDARGRRADRGRPPAGTAERYRKVRLHAQGGLGAVSIARDEQLKRDVALKQLQDRHADDYEKQQRFLLEGEVTGALEHPGIVPVYSLGFDAADRPFYAMRLIRGIDLETAIHDLHAAGGTTPRSVYQSLRFRRLVQRLVDVCNAMEYAHSRGVLHRDLKPANVMLGKYSEAYVVDWGLARVSGAVEDQIGRQSEAPLEPSELSGGSGTQMGSTLGTPAFMSPEQALGRLAELTVRSDVFSLGATLYFLLCDRAPYGGDDLLSVIGHAQRAGYEPPRQRCPAIPKKLEAICLKAMAFDRANRYESAAALGQDLERWLADEPVVASPDTLAERTFRFLRRHRSWVLAVTTALLLCIVVAIAAAVLINGARERAEQLAERNAVLAEQEADARQEAEQRFLHARETVDTWLTGFSEALVNYPGVSEFRRQMLEQAAAEYERFVAERTDDPLLRLEQGRTWIRLGDIRRKLAQPEEAATAYQEAIKSLPLARSAASHSQALDAQQLERARTVSMAHGKLALAAADLGDDQLAQTAFLEAIHALSELPRSVRTETHIAEPLAAATINYASYLARQNRLDDAERRLQEGLTLLERAVAADRDSVQLQTTLAAAKLGLGQIKLQRGDAASARDWIAAALSIYNGAVDLQGDDPTRRDQRAVASLYLASVERQLGNLRGEADAYEDVINDYEALTTYYPGSIVYRENLALTQTDLSQLLLELFRVDEALTTVESARQTLGELHDAYPAVPRFLEAYAVACDMEGQARQARGEYREAEAMFETSHAGLTRLSDAFPETPNYRQRLALVAMHQALARYGQSDAGGAIELLQGAIEQLATLSEDYPDAPSHRYYLAAGQSLLGDVRWRRGEHDAARAAYRLAAQTWLDLTAASADPVYLDGAAWFLGTCPVEAIRQPSQALSLAGRAVDRGPGNVRFHDTLAMAQYQVGLYDAALATLGMAKPRAEPRTVPPRELARGRQQFIAALVHHKLDSLQLAQEQFDEAAQWTSDHAPGDWQLQMLELVYRERIDDRED